MALIPKYEPADPTMEAVDREIERKAALETFRPHLGMSSIGKECERELWLDFRWVTKPTFSAETLKMFEDGHRTEDLMMYRLRLAPGITLFTHNIATGKQYGFSDHGGHYGGSIDGAVLGLIQAPKTWHVAEVKATDIKVQAKLTAAIKTHGEKGALKVWKPTYYAQAVSYMFYSGMERHYLMASLPGGRGRPVTVRTNSDPETALRMTAKAKRVIFSPRPLERISNDPSWFGCKWCSHQGNCHGNTLPETTCRSCLHSTPEPNGTWSCARFSKPITFEEQLVGCGAHLYVPDLIAGTVTDAGDDFVEYRMRDGRVWRDGVGAK